jgi:C-terminal peptidase prc
VNDTLKEVVLSLDASSVTKVPLDRYVVAGLDAIAATDPCLERALVGNTLHLACRDATLTSTWPPVKPLEVATLLTNAVRLVDPQRVVLTTRVERVCRALAMANDDPFTAYLSPTMMLTATTMKHGLAAAAPGIDLWPRDPSRVREVRLGSDAAQKGIAPGDAILAIDGVNVASLSYIEVLQRMSGMNASTVRLTVHPGRGGAQRTVDVARLLVPDDDIRRSVIGSVLYLGIPVFKSGVADSVRQALGVANYAGVILDLRHNPGGLLPEAVALLDTFLRDGVIAGVRSGPGRPSDDFVAHRDAFDTMVPLVVLVDGGSASASELTAMVLKERSRAVLLGVTTAGKGSVQRQIPTPDGGLLKVTAGYYVGPTGQRLDEGGVRPHRQLAPSPRRTALEGGNPADDSWVLSALDSLQQVERNASFTPAVGPAP